MDAWRAAKAQSIEGAEAIRLLSPLFFCPSLDVWQLTRGRLWPEFKGLSLSESQILTGRNDPVRI